MSAQKFKEVIRYQVTVKFTVPVITMQQTNIGASWPKCFTSYSFSLHKFVVRRRVMRPRRGRLPNLFLLLIFFLRGQPTKAG